MWTWPGSAGTDPRHRDKYCKRPAKTYVVHSAKISNRHSTVILNLPDSHLSTHSRGLWGFWQACQSLGLSPPLSCWTQHSHHPSFSYTRTHTHSPYPLAAMWPHFNPWYLSSGLSELQLSVSDWSHSVTRCSRPLKQLLGLFLSENIWLTTIRDITLSSV